MTKQEIINLMAAQDPDYIVDVLEISSMELLIKFRDKVDRFIEEEYEYEESSCVQDEENYTD